MSLILHRSLPHMPVWEVRCKTSQRSRQVSPKLQPHLPHPVWEVRFSRVLQHRQARPEVRKVQVRPVPSWHRAMPVPHRPCPSILPHPSGWEVGFILASQRPKQVRPKVRKVPLRLSALLLPSSGKLEVRCRMVAKEPQVSRFPNRCSMITQEPQVSRLPNERSMFTQAPQVSRLLDRRSVTTQGSQVHRMATG